MTLLEISFTNYVPTTVIGLLGLLFGYLYFYFTQKNKNKIEELKSLKQNDRAKLMEMMLNELGVQIDTTTLEPSQKFQIINNLLAAKTKKYLIIAITLIALSVIIGFVVMKDRGQGSSPVDKIDTIPRQDVPLPIKPSLDTLPTKKDSALADNIKALIYKTSCGSSIGELIAYEYGEQYRNSIAYDSLPQSTECLPNVVRYLYKKLDQSKSSTHIYNYLEHIGLRQDITDDCAFVYSFMDNKLAYIQLIFYSPSNTFYNSLMTSLGQDMVAHPTRFKTKIGEYYYITEYRKRENSVYIIMADKTGYNFCSVNWWQN